MNQERFGSQSFDILDELAKFGLKRAISLNDPQTVSEFSAYVSDAVAGALSNPALLHGQRTQALILSK